MSSSFLLQNDEKSLNQVPLISFELGQTSSNISIVSNNDNDNNNNDNNNDNNNNNNNININNNDNDNDNDNNANDNSRGGEDRTRDSRSSRRDNNDGNNNNSVVKKDGKNKQRQQQQQRDSTDKRTKQQSFSVATHYTDFDYVPLVGTEEGILTAEHLDQAQQQYAQSRSNNDLRIRSRLVLHRRETLGEALGIYDFKSTRQYVAGLIAMATSALLSAVASLIVQYAHRYGFESTEILFARGVTTFVLLLIFDVFNHFHFGVNLELPNLFNPALKYPFRRSLRWILLSGVFSGAATMCNYYALTKLSLGNAVCVYCTYPVFSFIMGHFLNNEPLFKRHIVATVLVLLGVVLVAEPTFIFGDNGSAQQPAIGYIMALLAAMFMACKMATIRKLIHEREVLLICLYAQALIGALLHGFIFSYVFYQNFFEGTNERITSKNLAWPILWSIGGLTIWSNFCVNFALRRIVTGEAALIGPTEIGYAYIIEFFTTEKTSDPIETVGIAIMVGTLLLLAVYNVYLQKVKGQEVAGH